MRMSAIALLFTLSACQGPLAPIPPQEFDATFACPGNFITDRLDHLVRLNKNGLVSRQDRSNTSFFGKLSADPVGRREAGESFQNTVCAAELLAKQKAAPGNGRHPVKVLVFVHGGLNSLGDTDDRIDAYAQNIVNDADDWHFPIFVSWPSDAASTYVDQLFSIREGRPTNRAIGALTSPIMFASDVLKSIGNFPATAYYQFTTEKDRASTVARSQWLSRAWGEAGKKVCAEPAHPSGVCLPGTDAQVKVNTSDFYTAGFERYYNAATTTSTIPVRYTIGSVWHSGISRSAWDNMKRRTQNVFYPPQSFDARQETGVAGGQFFDFLLARAQYMSVSQGIDYEITLMGHSMGAIVINHALEKNPIGWATSGALTRIVYMAGAATINETLNAVGPVLKGGSNSGRPIAFHNLTLNRVAEISEAHAWGIVPLGSLLVSIDQHHETPEHPLERTVGSEINVHTSIDIIDRRLRIDGRPREAGAELVFKSFDRCPNALPAKHGDFGKIAFWKKVTWEAGNTGCSERDRILIP